MNRNLSFSLISTLSFTILFLLSGCTSTNNQSTSLPKTLYSAQSTVSSTIPNWLIDSVKPVDFDTRDIYQLTESQATHFLSFYNDPKHLHLAQHERLGAYLESYIKGFTYEGGTKVASEGLFDARGNCMTLATITSALANLVDLKVIHRLVNRSPLFMKQNNISVSSQHMRTSVYEPRANNPEASDQPIKYIVIDYYRAKTDLPSDAVTDKEFNALFYSNLAAEELLNNQLEQAYQFSYQAMSLDNKNSDIINIHAVILNRLGHKKKAFDLYEYAFEHQPNSLNALANFQRTLLLKGDKAYAKLVETKLLESDDDNPYRWLSEGYRKLNDNKLSLALSIFEKAQSKAPYLDDVYLAQAKVYNEMGKPTKTKALLHKAMNAPIRSNEQNLYLAKLANFDR